MKSILVSLFFTLTISLSAQSVQEYHTMLKKLRTEALAIKSCIDEIYSLSKDDIYNGMVYDISPEGKQVFTESGAPAYIYKPERIEKWNELLKRYYSNIKVYRKTLKYFDTNKNEYLLTANEENKTLYDFGKYIPVKGYLLNPVGENIHFLKFKSVASLIKLNSKLKRQIKPDCNTCHSYNVIIKGDFKKAQSDNLIAIVNIAYFINNVTCEAKPLNTAYVKSTITSLRVINEQINQIITKEKPELIKKRYNNLILKQKADKYRKENIYTYPDDLINENKIINLKIDKLYDEYKGLIIQLEKIKEIIILSGNVDGTYLEGTLDKWILRENNIIENELENIKKLRNFASSDITTLTSPDQALENCKNFIKSNTEVNKALKTLEKVSYSIQQD